ncbi:MAG TPA: hypothetical protein VJ698_11660 [Noviherbaspirillum sp.]|uniref:hypothetical protein n=1 Tax=Noviherbaspirillum sp. TaxID=1926288 RepID=UPI002B4A88E9|nr:hypothetical protein [Noviherbaspirillum sp.]HJV86119.1 hypothetical protein [Noviherbaspirillum sp.]
MSALYGASGIAATALYLPQILKYHRDREARLSISLLAWSGWIAIAAISVLYALVVARNPLFAMVAGMNIAAQLVVLSYGIASRVRRRG